MVRQMLRFGLTGGGAAAPGGGAAVPGGRTRDVGSSPTLEADRRGDGSAAGAGAGAGSFEGVAQQLLEIFPDMEWDAALRAARLANGSAERAVEFALSSDSPGQGVVAGAAGDEPGVGGPSLATSLSTSTSSHSAQHSAAAAGGGGDVAEGRRRWW